VTDNRLVTYILLLWVAAGLMFGGGMLAGKALTHPQPASDGLVSKPWAKPDVTYYGPPRNVQVRCTYRISPNADPEVGPIPGQTFIQTCKSSPYLEAKTKTGGPKS